MTKEEKAENIKYRLSDIGVQVGKLAIEYITDLEKENEQLKCDLYNTDANLQHITIEYEEENAELKEQIENLEEDKGQIIFESDLKIRALEEMIEKMKNVGNCKYTMQCSKWVEKKLYLGQSNYCQNCKDWELAE